MMGSAKRQALVRDIVINGVLALFCFLWIIPSAGLFISSFRDHFTIQTSGWWDIFPHREYKETERLEGDELPRDFDKDVPFSIPAISDQAFTFDEWREGVTVGDNRIQWKGNKRIGWVEIQEPVITADTNFTLENYEIVLGGKKFELERPDGSKEIVQGDNMSDSFLNTAIVAIPSTLLPTLIAAFAAYAFAWMRFPGRRAFFITMIAMLVVPLQIALVPVLRDYTRLGINGTFLAIWLAHTGFGIPFATYLIYNYVSTLPHEILEAAYIDGASHFTVFVRLVLPLTVPALASYIIFQFLWVWNDYLIALIFIGETGSEVLTMRVANMIGSRGNDWHLLTSGAFVTMVVPLIVFFLLQRYFIRGLISGSVKG
jgi:alpha-glucoside transport system permease protein